MCGAENIEDVATSNLAKIAKLIATLVIVFINITPFNQVEDDTVTFAICGSD